METRKSKPDQVSPGPDVGSISAGGSGARRSARRRLTVYFDGACPLCSREIAMYRRMKGADRVRWVDIHGASPESLGPDLTREQALGRFHVRGADGSLVSGGAGFAAVWRTLPALRWLGWLAGRPPLAWLLEPAYRLFLRIRPWLVRRQVTSG